MAFEFKPSKREIGWGVGGIFVGGGLVVLGRKIYQVIQNRKRKKVFENIVKPEEKVNHSPEDSSVKEKVKSSHSSSKSSDKTDEKNSKNED